MEIIDSSWSLSQIGRIVGSGIGKSKYKWWWGRLNGDGWIRPIRTREVVCLLSTLPAEGPVCYGMDGVAAGCLADVPLLPYPPTLLRHPSWIVLFRDSLIFSSPAFWHLRNHCTINSCLKKLNYYSILLERMSMRIFSKSFLNYLTTCRNRLQK